MERRDVLRNSAVACSGLLAVGTIGAKKPPETSVKIESRDEDEKLGRVVYENIVFLIIHKKDTGRVKMERVGREGNVFIEQLNEGPAPQDDSVTTVDAESVDPPEVIVRSAGYQWNRGSCGAGCSFGHIAKGATFELSRPVDALGKVAVGAVLSYVAVEYLGAWRAENLDVSAAGTGAALGYMVDYMMEFANKKTDSLITYDYDADYYFDKQQMTGVNFGQGWKQQLGGTSGVPFPWPRHHLCNV